MKIDAKEIEWLNDLVTQVAAAEIMPRFRNLDAGDVSEKESATDLVTIADETAEREIAKALTARFPDALVVGEEAHAADSSILDGLASAPLAFTIDPVDGTFNFARGVPLFGTMLAVVQNGETVAGIIHDPVGGDSLLAVKGQGSVVRSPGKSDSQQKVATPVETAELVGTVSWNFVPEPTRSTIAGNLVLMNTGLSFRCAAHEYRLAATGGLHYVLYNKLMPWDHLAGVLIHAEAGGHTARFDGSPYNCSTLEGGLIAAPDEESWHRIKSALFDGKI
ncbi:MAG: inositol monophosphatase family protein [Rhizobiaceae bacterium]